MPRQVETIKGFARMIFDLLHSDRDVNVGVGGFTGEGKSTFSTLLQQAYAEVSGTKWDFNRMTWSRKELMMWIDGEKGSPINEKTGLRKGQLPEYSAILPDELFAMFYRRNWYEDDQIDAISTFNMCRDRHLFLCGNIPLFWELDSSFISRMRFYVYISERGRAWVFQQENNPFCNDNWNVNDNRKNFRKKRNPYSIPNFICEIQFPDWNADDKEKYLQMRNTKRIEQFSDNKGEKKERYGKVKKQRDEMLKYHMFEKQKLRDATRQLIKSFPTNDVITMPQDIKKPFQLHLEKLKELKDSLKLETYKDLGDIMDLSEKAIGMILRGER